MEEHIPVLLNEVIEIAEGLEHEPTYFFDGTFGRGGHCGALMQEFPEMTVVALDRDKEAVQYGLQKFVDEKIHFFQGNFHDFKKLNEESFQPITHGNGFDLMLIDLGVSSPQLDRPERGFSFYSDGPLDMRMDQTQELTASDIINTWDEQSLSNLFYTFGEIRRPNRVVRSIVEARKQRLFSTTRELSSLIEQTEGWRKKGQHPATRFFLALRMEVNKELDPLHEALLNLIRGLSNGGRLIVLTFHSLEDRIVKNTFRNSSDLGRPVNKKVIQPAWEEKKKNMRARSAKLRAFQRQEEKNESTASQSS